MLVFVVGVGLFGCGSSGPSIAGTWESSFKGGQLTLTAKPDTSFAIHGTTDIVGKWEVSGNEVKLYRDVRNGGGAGFGDGGDGAIHFKLSQDGRHMDGVGGDGTAFSFTKR
jgi:hypothetical protein